MLVPTGRHLCALPYSSESGPIHKGLWTANHVVCPDMPLLATLLCPCRLGGCDSFDHALMLAHCAAQPVSAVVVGWGVPLTPLGTNTCSSGLFSLGFLPYAGNCTTRMWLQVAVPQVMVPGGCNSMYPLGLYPVCSCTRRQLVQHAQVHQVASTLYHLDVEVLVPVNTSLACTVKLLQQN